MPESSRRPRTRYVSLFERAGYVPSARFRTRARGGVTRGAYGLGGRVDTMHDGPGGDLGAGREPKLVQDVLHVGLGGSLRDHSAGASDFKAYWIAASSVIA